MKNIFQSFLKFHISILLGILLASFGSVACDSNVNTSASGGTDPTDPSLSIPTNSVAVNVGPVENLLTADVLSEVNTIHDSILDDVATLTGDTGDSGFLKSAAQYLDSNASVSGDFQISSGAVACDSGGTKTVSGSYTMEYTPNTTTGTIVGSFTTTYSNCLNIAEMVTSTGTCGATPSINGALATTISSEFSLSSSQSEQEVNVDTTVSSATSSALSVAVGSTASTQSYVFEYTILSISTDTGLTGTVSYAGDLFDIIDVEDYVAASTKAIVCP